jgi:hypothetical protein
MAGKGGFSVVISATDAASATIGAVNKRLEALNKPVRDMQASTARLGHALGQFGRLTGVAPVVSGIARGFRGLRDTAAKTVSFVSRLAPALGAITAAGTVAGVAALASQFGQFGTALRNAGARAGIADDQLMAMQGGARLAGASAGALTSGITALRDNLVDAVGGRAPEFVRMMQSIGVAWQDGAGHARNYADVLPQVADKIAAIRDPTLQARVATALFGGAAEELLPWLRKGSAGINAYNAEARRYGVLNQQGVEAADQMRTAQTRLGLAFEGLGYSVAERVAPVLTPMLNQLADFVASKGPAVADTVNTVAEAFGNWVKTGGMEPVRKGLLTVRDDAKFVSDSLGLAKVSTETWTRALELLGISIGLRVTGLSGLAGALARLSLIQLPSWLAALLGVPTAIAAGATLGAGALGGSMGIPLMGPDGQIITPYGAPGTAGNNPQEPFVPLGTKLWRWITGSNGGSTPPQDSATTKANRDESWNFWKSHGFSPAGAAAMMAAERSESGFNPGSIGDGGAARGSFQWHPDRQAQIKAATGIDVADPKTTHLQQLQAMYTEMVRGLDPQTGAAYPAIRDAVRIEDAVRAAVNGVERPRDRLGRFMDDTAAASGYAQQYGAAVSSPLVAAPAAPAASGKADMTIRLHGFPDGATTTMDASGDLWSAPPKVERAMPAWVGG